MNTRCRSVGFMILKQSRKQIGIRLFSSETKMTKVNFKNNILKPIERKHNASVLKSLKCNDHGILRSKTVRNNKKYILSMFPYPSGNLHMGHARVYTTADAIARFFSMKGYEVIHPMGWDAFGLPAENAAIERNENPFLWTARNISSMKQQLNNLGCCFDWSRELSTCDPVYYKWTQMLFLKLYKTGLAYRQEAVVNWDPVDKTVLADEQVSPLGISWRSGAKVEKKLLKQWFIKTTRYAKDLYKEIDLLPKESWGKVSAIQKHWIGEVNGYAVELQLVDSENNSIGDNEKLTIWMPNPEHLINISFIGIRSGTFLDQEKYIKFKEDGFKKLVLHAVEPISKKLIPIIITDALDYMPDCQVYTGIPIINAKDRPLCSAFDCTENYCDLKDFIDVKFSPFSNAREIVLNWLTEAGCGGYETSAKLKDWLVSRQRYWGTPIPILYCDKCGTLPVPEEELPVTLPDVSSLVIKGASTLRESQDWYYCQCPSCGEVAVRETDTLDTFVDSSWYFLRFLDRHNDKEMFSKDKADLFMPVDLYIGGIEHAELHLYYARFIAKFLNKEGLLSAKEPFQTLLTLAVVKSKAYQVKETSKYLNSQEVDFSGGSPVEKTTKAEVRVKYEKMSKSKNNGIDPQSVVDEFGIDTTRFSILTMSDAGMDIKWKDDDVWASLSFLEKVNFYVKSLVDSRVDGLPNTPRISEEETRSREGFLDTTRNKFVLRITRFYEEFKFVHVRLNLQEMLNEIVSTGQIMLLNDEYERSLRALILILAPICPHTSAELWEMLNSVSNLSEKVNYINLLTVNVPFCEYELLTKESAVTLAMQSPEICRILKTTPASDVEFNPSEIVPYVNFFTKPKEEILREIDCEVLNNVVCTIEIPQDEYLKLTENRANDIAWNNDSLRHALKPYVIRKRKFYYNISGRSKLKFSVVNRPLS